MNGLNRNKFKFQRIDHFDSKFAKLVMNLSYNENNVMLYEIVWEVGLSHIRVYSHMTNQKQVQWKIPQPTDEVMSKSKHSSESLTSYLGTLLTTINTNAYEGKLNYNVDLQNLSYEIMIMNIPEPFKNEHVKLLCEGLHKSACKFVLEVSNMLILFNSNPSLGSREICELSKRYSIQPQITVEDFSKNYEPYDDKKNIGKLPMLENDQLEVWSRVDGPEGKIVYRGLYLTLPCLFIQLDSIEKFKDYIPIQYESIPALYGYWNLGLQQTQEGYEILEEQKEADTYLVAETQEGDMYIGEHAIQFLKTKKPSSVNSVLYEYFSTLWFQYSKGRFIPTELVLYDDGEPEQAQSFQPQNEEKDSSTDWVLPNSSIHVSLFPFYPPHYKQEIKNLKKKYNREFPSKDVLTSAVEVFIHKVNEIIKKVFWSSHSYRKSTMGTNTWILIFSGDSPISWISAARFTWTWL